jgi:hypothetical protein
MARRRFRYDPDLKEMVEIHYADEGSSDFPMVAGDIPAFVSPLDGTVVEGKRAYYEHMRKHGVVPYEAGDEKAKVESHQVKQRARQEMRERLWEYADKAQQRGPGRSIRD